MTRTWRVPRPVPRSWHFDCAPRPVVREPDLGLLFVAPDVPDVRYWPKADIGRVLMLHLGPT